MRCRTASAEWAPPPPVEPLAQPAKQRTTEIVVGAGVLTALLVRPPRCTADDAPCDVGLGGLNDGYHVDKLGTYAYMAPEMMTGAGGRTRLAKSPGSPR